MTACKRHRLVPAHAVATQGNIAFTQTVGRNTIKTRYQNGTN